MLSSENQEKLEHLTDLIEQTFDWGCNDEAWDLYAHAVYSVVSGNENFKDCEHTFENYVNLT